MAARNDGRVGRTEYSRYLDDTLRPATEFRWTALDLFAGCGGLALGFEAAGFRTIGFEWDQDAVDSYNKNLAGECFREYLNEDTELPAADIVIGGPPCQPFSVGGLQQGMRDDRDGFPAFIAAVESVQPKVFLFENVRGLLYRNKEYFEGVLRRLRRIGYDIEVQLLNAVDFGVPQNRQRVVVVGHRGAYEYPDPDASRITVAEALGDYLSYAPTESKFLTPNQDAYVARYEEKSKCVTPRDLHHDRPARTVTCRNLAGATGDMHRVRLPDGRRRRLLLEEAARLQSFPDWFEFCGTEASRLNQIGNAVPPLLAFRLAQSVEASMLGRATQGSKATEELSLFSVDGMEGVSRMTTEKDLEPLFARMRGLVTFKQKSEPQQRAILQALTVLEELGLPIHDLVTTPRQAERRGLALLALADLTAPDRWMDAKDISQVSLRTRDILEWLSVNLDDKRSSGTYDDVRRVDLLWMSLAGIAANSGDAREGSSHHAPNRSWGLAPAAAEVIRSYGTSEWPVARASFLDGKPTLEELLKAPREIARTDVRFRNAGTEIVVGLSENEHNELIRACVTEFLPNFGHDAEVLYLGDFQDRDLYKDAERLKELGVYELAGLELPDIVAFSADKQWLFVIEAVHSVGPVSREKHLRYKELFASCKVGVVYVTAFANLRKFAEFASSIAWETEVWIASDPTHMIHYNGDRFMGPHQAE